VVLRLTGYSGNTCTRWCTRLQTVAEVQHALENVVFAMFFFRGHRYWPVLAPGRPKLNPRMGKPIRRDS
jgi:hypothetical protein